MVTCAPIGGFSDAVSYLTTVPTSEISRLALYVRSKRASEGMACCASKERQSVSDPVSMKSNNGGRILDFIAPSHVQECHSQPFCVAENKNTAKRKRRG